MSENKDSRKVELLEMIAKDVHTVKAIVLFYFIASILILVLGFLGSSK